MNNVWLIVLISCDLVICWSIGAGVWSAGISCNSCGSECEPACGTRHFRACCFNYLRKKRNDATDNLKSWRRANMQEKLKENMQEKNKKNPVFELESPIESIFLKPMYSTNEFEPNALEDLFQNRLQMIYDA